MKSLLIILIAITLAGCSGSVNKYQNDEATYLCSTNSGVNKVIPAVMDSEVVCNNGAYFYGIPKSGKQQ